MRAKQKIESVDALLLWPTQIIVARYSGTEELNRRLLALMESDGFWTCHHKPGGDLWRYEPDCAALTELREMFADCAQRWLAEARLPARPVEQQNGWTYRYAAGEYIDIHDHGNIHLVAAYYVEVPPAAANPAKPSRSTPAEGGQIVFHDCRRGVSRIVREWQQAAFHAVRPLEGMLITFPGHLLHQVKPFLGPGTRTVVSNNMWFALQR